MADIKRESVREPSNLIPPSNFELREIQYRGERGKPTDAKGDEGRRALYMAGVAAGESESEAWRLAAAKAQDELAEVKAKLDTSRYRNKQLRRIARDFAADRSRAYAEASAAKEKLADAERERDRAKTELARERDEARSEIERARRVVETLTVAGDALMLSTVGFKPDAQMAAARVGWKNARRDTLDALASATSSQPADVDASVIVDGKSISETPEAETGDHDFSGQDDLASAKCRRCGVEPADYLHQPLPACVPTNSETERSEHGRFTKGR